MSDHIDPWQAVHHEDAPPDPAPKPEPNPARPRPEPKADAAVPIAMMLMIPPELTAAISSLVEGQAALTEQIGKLVASNAELLARIATTPPPVDPAHIE